MQFFQYLQNKNEINACVTVIFFGFRKLLKRCFLLKQAILTKMTGVYHIYQVTWKI